MTNKYWICRMLTLVSLQNSLAQFVHQGLSQQILFQKAFMKKRQHLCARIFDRPKLQEILFIVEDRGFETHNYPSYRLDFLRQEFNGQTYTSGGQIRKKLSFLFLFSRIHWIKDCKKPKIFQLSWESKSSLPGTIDLNSSILSSKFKSVFFLCGQLWKTSTFSLLFESCYSGSANNGKLSVQTLAVINQTKSMRWSVF